MQRTPQTGNVPASTTREAKLTIINQQNSKNQLFSRFLPYFFLQRSEQGKRSKVVLVEARNGASKGQNDPFWGRYRRVFTCRKPDFPGIVSGVVFIMSINSGVCEG